MNGGKKFTFQVLKKTLRLRCQTFPERRVIFGNDQMDGMLFSQGPPGKFQKHILDVSLPGR